MPRKRMTATKARKARQKALRAGQPAPNHPPKTVTRRAALAVMANLKPR